MEISSLYLPGSVHLLPETGDRMVAPKTSFKCLDLGRCHAPWGLRSLVT